MNLRFSWLTIFFLQIIYLQYKMNRISSTNIIVSAASQKETGTRRKSILQSQDPGPKEEHRAETVFQQAKGLDSPVSFTVKGVSFNMVRVPAGEFMMGSPASEPYRLESEGPQHLVRISRAFWMGETQVTRKLWKAVMKKNPSYFKKRGAIALSNVCRGTIVRSSSESSAVCFPEAISAFPPKLSGKMRAVPRRQGFMPGTCLRWGGVRSILATRL